MAAVSLAALGASSCCTSGPAVCRATGAAYHICLLHNSCTTSQARHLSVGSVTLKLPYHAPHSGAQPVVQPITAELL